MVFNYFCFAFFFLRSFFFAGLLLYYLLLAVRTLEGCYCCCCGYLIPLLQFIPRAANALSIYLVNCTNDTFLTSANFSIWSSSSS